jgi:hypothetical protein
VTPRNDNAYGSREQVEEDSTRATVLKIVWRNPVSVPAGGRRVERLAIDDYGAIYAVHRLTETTVFELILRRAA